MMPGCDEKNDILITVEEYNAPDLIILKVLEGSPVKKFELLEWILAQRLQGLCPVEPSMVNSVWSLEIREDLLLTRQCNVQHSCR